jgi:hypothetical protein
MTAGQVAALVARARGAQEVFARASQDTVDLAVVAAGWPLMEPSRNRALAEQAVRDTGLTPTRSAAPSTMACRFRVDGLRRLGRQRHFRQPQLPRLSQQHPDCAPDFAARAPDRGDFS